MRYGWAYVYEVPSGEFVLCDLRDYFERTGISLENPGTGLITKVTQQGDQVPTSVEDLAKEFHSVGRVHLHWWMNDSTDIFCSLKRLGERLLLIAYSLDGLSESESASLIQSLVELFKKRAELGLAQAIVVDELAELNKDFHWNDFVLGRGVKRPYWPMVIGVANELKDKMIEASPDHELETASHYRLQVRRYPTKSSPGLESFG